MDGPTSSSPAVSPAGHSDGSNSSVEIVTITAVNDVGRVEAKACANYHVTGTYQITAEHADVSGPQGNPACHECANSQSETAAPPETAALNSGNCQLCGQPLYNGDATGPSRGSSVSKRLHGKFLASGSVAIEGGVATSSYERSQISTVTTAAAHSTFAGTAFGVPRSDVSVDDLYCDNLYVRRSRLSPLPSQPDVQKRSATGPPSIPHSSDAVSTTATLPLLRLRNGALDYQTPMAAPVNHNRERSLPSAVSEAALYPRAYRDAGYAYSGGSQYVMGNKPVDRNLVLSEKVIEHEVRRPKRMIVEEIVERSIVVPERRVREEFTEEVETVYEKIVEVAKPVIREKIIEVPEYEYVEKIVEVPELVIQEKIRQVPVINYEERTVEVPRIIQQEKIVEVPQVEYNEVPVDKLVELPEIHEQVVVKEIPIPQYIDKPVAEFVDVEVSQDVVRSIPVPLEAITTVEFVLPKIRQHWSSVDVPLYVPRFVEIAVPCDMLDESGVQMAEEYAKRISALGSAAAVGLCEMETLARDVKSADFYNAFQHFDHSAMLQRYVEQVKPTTPPPPHISMPRLTMPTACPDN